MPTVEIDVTKQYENLYDQIIKQINSGSGVTPLGYYNPYNLNPGQIATLNNLSPDITATAEVNISGRDIDINVEVIADFGNVPEYISETVDSIIETFQLYSGKLEGGRSYDSTELIKNAFEEL